MAFTESEEAIIKQLIEAFQNGKRLSDLPNVKGKNPFDLFVEVLDIDGESKKAALATLLPYLEEQCAYGVEYDTTVSSPICTRVGNLALHKTLPIQNKMRGCLLDDDGKVVRYLNPTDWTTAHRDGSEGQVMVEIPMHYRRFITDGTKIRTMISEYPLPGYHVVPLHYDSAYEATMQRSTKKLSSVATTAEDYRGGNNDATLDGTAASQLGMPATQISRTNYRTYARNRKPGSAEWNCYTYEAHKTLYWLFVVEYATLNSQAEFNAEPTAEGFMQGGLGAGVTNVNGTKWATFNKYYPLIPCGCSDSLGNRTGVVQYSLPAEYDETILTVSVPRYRGIENPFGHIYKWTDGINVKISANEENGGTGLSEIYVCHDPELFTDSSYDGYHHVGNLGRTEGYTKNIVFGEEGDILPKESGGGSPSYFCDSHWTKIPDSGEALRGLLFGSNAISGANAGLAYANSNCLSSYTLADIGSRLCFFPR